VTASDVELVRSAWDAFRVATSAAATAVLAPDARCYGANDPGNEGGCHSRNEALAFIERAAVPDAGGAGRAAVCLAARRRHRREPALLPRCPRLRGAGQRRYKGSFEPTERAERPIDEHVRIGHVHRRTAGIDRVRAFYVGILGFDVVFEARDVPAWGTTGDILSCPLAATTTSASAPGCLETAARRSMGARVCTTWR